MIAHTRFSILSLLIFCSTAQNLPAQNLSGEYKGFERMCWINEKGKLECFDQPRKWYHVNKLYIENDSAFLYQEPVQIKKKDTSYSASDGAFFYYAGTITKSDSGRMIHLKKISCDYCYRPIQIDSITGFMYPVLTTDHYKLEFT